MSNAAGWKYSRKGKLSGLVTEEQVAALVRSGELAPDDMVWSRDLDCWQPVSAVMERWSGTGDTNAPPPTPQQAPPPAPAQPQAPAEPLWKVSKNGQLRGGVPWATVSSMIQSGELAPEDQVWSPEARSWQPVSEVREALQAEATAAAQTAAPVGAAESNGQPEKSQESKSSAGECSGRLVRKWLVISGITLGAAAFCVATGLGLRWALRTPAPTEGVVASVSNSAPQQPSKPVAAAPQASIASHSDAPAVKPDAEESRSALAAVMAHPSPTPAPAVPTNPVAQPARLRTDPAPRPYPIPPPTPVATAVAPVPIIPTSSSNPPVPAARPAPAAPPEQPVVEPAAPTWAYHLPLSTNASIMHSELTRVVAVKQKGGDQTIRVTPHAGPAIGKSIKFDVLTVDAAALAEHPAFGVIVDPNAGRITIDDVRGGAAITTATLQLVDSDGKQVARVLVSVASADPLVGALLDARSRRDKARIENQSALDRQKQSASARHSAEADLARLQDIYRKDTRPPSEKKSLTAQMARDQKTITAQIATYSKASEDVNTTGPQLEAANTDLERAQQACIERLSGGI